MRTDKELLADAIRRLFELRVQEKLCMVQLQQIAAEIARLELTRYDLETKVLK